MFFKVHACYRACGYRNAYYRMNKIVVSEFKCHLYNTLHRFTLYL